MLSQATYRPPTELKCETLLERVGEGHVADETSFALVVSTVMRRVANENSIIVSGLPQGGRSADPSRVKLVTRGHMLVEELATG